MEEVEWGGKRWIGSEHNWGVGRQGCKKNIEKEWVNLETSLGFWDMCPSEASFGLLELGTQPLGNAGGLAPGDLSPARFRALGRV